MSTTKEATGPKGHFLFGMALKFKEDPIKFLQLIDGQQPDISRFRFAWLPMLYVGKPEYIQHILQTENKKYKKGIEYEELKYTLGEGLLTSEGSFWLRQRRLAQPAFHKKRIASFAGKISDSTAEMLAEWDKLEKGKPFDVNKEMMKLTLDIVGKTLLSADVKGDASFIDEALSMVIAESFARIQTLINMPVWLPLPKHIELKKNIKVLDDVVFSIINERRQDKGDYNDLLTMLMEAEDADTGEKMSDKQLRDEVMTIFLAGHETTANAMTWMLYLISQNPKAEAKLQEEVTRVLDGRVPTFEDTRELVYTTQVINESMRLYPPAWILGRTALQDDIIDGFQIKKGDNILIAPYMVHRSELLWDNPTEFRPERFEGDAAKHMNKFQFFPFGGGPRLCIGNNFALLEMQLALAMIVQKSKLRMDPNHQVELEPLVTLRPKNGMMMFLD